MVDIPNSTGWLRAWWCSTTALTSFTFRYSSVCATFMNTCFKQATIFFQPVHPHSNVSFIRNIAWINEPSPKAFGVAITDFGCFRNACAANPRSSPTSNAMTTVMGSTGDHNKMKLNLSAPVSYKERKKTKLRKKGTNLLSYLMRNCQRSICCVSHDAFLSQIDCFECPKVLDIPTLVSESI